jgi:hypothetical protein
MVHALCGMSTALNVVDAAIEQFQQHEQENSNKQLVVVRLNGACVCVFLNDLF